MCYCILALVILAQPQFPTEYQGVMGLAVDPDSYLCSSLSGPCSV